MGLRRNGRDVVYYQNETPVAPGSVLAAPPAPASPGDTCFCRDITPVPIPASLTWLTTTPDMTCIESLGLGLFFQGGFLTWPQLLEAPDPCGVVQEISLGPRVRGMGPGAVGHPGPAVTALPSGAHPDDRALEGCHGCGSARRIHRLLASMGPSLRGRGGIIMGSNLPGRKEGASVLEVHCTFKAQFQELHWAWGK